MNDQQSAWAILKIVSGWLGAVVGALTLSKLVLFATLVFTVLQTYLLIRDRLLPSRSHNKQRK